MLILQNDYRQKISLFLLNLMLCSFCVLFISMNRFFLSCRWWVKFRLTKIRLTTTKFAQKKCLSFVLFLFFWKEKYFRSLIILRIHYCQQIWNAKNDKADRTLFCIHFACFSVFYLKYSFIQRMNCYINASRDFQWLTAKIKKIKQ